MGESREGTSGAHCQTCTRRQWLLWSCSLAGVACHVTPPESNLASTSNPARERPHPPANTEGAGPNGLAPSAKPESPTPPVAPTTPAEPVAVQNTPSLSIALQPLGDQLPSAHVELVKTALQTFYRCDVSVLARAELPQTAYTKARKRYRAERLLDTLLEVKPAQTQRILGLTAVDISTTKGNVADWGILGLATIDGSACVISSFRTSRGAKNDTHAAERLAKTAVHEIGHTLGLEHCPNKACLMEDGKGTVFTTDGEYELCPQCRAILERAAVPLAPPGTPPPWPRPQ